MTTNPTGRARARNTAQAVRVTARGLAAAAAAVLGVVASGLTASRATAQDGAIPSVSIPKAAATRAAAATNAHTAAMQQVDAPVTPRSNATTSATAPARAGTMTPISVSAPAAGTAAHGKTTGAATANGAAPAKAGAKGGAATMAAKGNTAMTAAPMSADTEPMSISVTQRGVKGEVSLNREVYSYDQGARRDPFISLMRSGDLRPMLSDLRLVTVLYDPTGQSSIAVMRDQSTKDQYRVRVGQTLGRMRVAQIEPKQVVFTIEEVGFSRQEALALGDSTKARTQ